MTAVVGGATCEAIGRPPGDAPTATGEVGTMLCCTQGGESSSFTPPCGQGCELLRCIPPGASVARVGWLEVRSAACGESPKGVAATGDRGPIGLQMKCVLLPEGASGLAGWSWEDDVMSSATTVMGLDLLRTCRVGVKG